MKNKIYIPFGKTILLYLIVFVVVLSATIFAFVKVENLGTLQKTVLTILNVILAYYFISPMFFYSIKMDDKKISIKKDFGIFPEDRIQNKTSVDLKDVKEYKVILSDRNSDGESYKGKTQKKKYLEFVLKNDQKKRFYVSDMSDKQILNIVNNVKNITNIEVKSE